MDMINHPPHYTAHPSGVECIQITEHMNFNLGNAMKYIWRAGEKNSTTEDLKKAKWYVEREIARLSTTEPPPQVSDPGEADPTRINPVRVSKQRPMCVVCKKRPQDPHSEGGGTLCTVCWYDL
jgi:hypothetical protein